MNFFTLLCDRSTFTTKTNQSINVRGDFDRFHYLNHAFTVKVQRIPVKLAQACNCFHVCLQVASFTGIR